MEFRRLIKFGGSSYVISIPKSWIEKNNLSKGDNIYLEEHFNELKLSTSERKKDKETTKEINAKNQSLSYVNREIISAYINGYNNIIIQGYVVKDLEKIRHMLHNLVALEILEQTSSKIIAKCLLDESEVSIDETVRRLYRIINSIMEDINETCGLLKKSKLTTVDSQNLLNIHTEIFNRDKDINRIFYLGLRIINEASEDPAMLKTIGKSHKELGMLLLLLDSLEKMGDELKGLARYLNPKYSLKSKEYIMKYFSIMHKIYCDSMTAYFKNDIKMAHQLATDTKEVITNLWKETKGDEGYTLIIDRIVILLRLSRNILRIVINKG